MKWLDEIEQNDLQISNDDFNKSERADDVVMDLVDTEVQTEVLHVVDKDV